MGSYKLMRGLLKGYYELIGVLKTYYYYYYYY